jgi:hypothetical protein
MATKYFSLGTGDSSKIVKIIRIIFGIVCITVAIFWLIFNIRSLQSDWTLWITIFFLSGFGFYQVWSGFDRAILFIEIGPGYIRLKKNPILPVIVIVSEEIEKIELFPMNVIFFLKTKKRIFLRFGTTYYETNEKVKDELITFSEYNKINVEIIEEKL